jgi:DNA (cytosine-5)-methyltransferase 1
MGVPQKRERVFFICQRNDLNFPKLELKFSEDGIPFRFVKTKENQYPLNQTMLRYWNKRIITDIDIANVAGRLDNRPNSFFNHKFLKDNEVANTITSGDLCTLYSEPRYRNDKEVIMCGTYPLDYNFKKIEPKYLIGMSVPPVMTAQIATEIHNQWFKAIGK